MSKPNVQNPGAAPAKEFKVNPFAGLSAAKLAPASPPPAPVVPSPQSKIETGKLKMLDRADRELLAAMGGGDAAVETGPRKPKVSFQYERKGRGGKEVTVVRGLGGISQEEQMNLLQALKKGLGVGAWFEDSLLLVQGDQTARLAKWFAAAGYRV